MKYLSYIAFRFVVALFSIIPFKLLYLLSDILRLILKHLFKYRIGVIDKNITYVFPDKAESWRREVRDEFYKSFIDIILESIKGLSVKPDKLIKRYKFLNPEILDPYYKNHQHVIFYSQHMNNWEWAPLCLGLQMQHHLVGAVKVLSNPHINAFLQRGRAGNNVSVVPTYEIGRYFQQLGKEEKTVGIVFIADQRPSGKERRTPVDFMGKEIDFHGGAGKYAVKSGFPVLTINVARLGRGKYQIEVRELSDGTITDAEALTQIYASHVAALITESPSAWLWSHKRFKEEINY